MWDRYPDRRRSLEWFAAPRSRNLAVEGLPTFEYRIERQFFPGLDFGWFKQSIHDALEAELERFGEKMGAEDLGSRRRPKNLARAFECLALRVCKDLSPVEISERPEYSRDWTTLSRDIKASRKSVDATSMSTTRSNTVQILNPAPDGAQYTTRKSAQQFVRRGLRACL